MARALRIWLRAGWRTYDVGAAGHYLTNEDETRLLLMHRNGSVEALA